MQELGNEIAARLIISPSTEFNTFAIGSTAPASNVGPWLKDCLEWFVFDDATASYVPITKGGFDTVEVKSASGTFIVPDFIYKLKIEAWGAGGGGCNVSGGSSQAGGAGGAYGLIVADVTPGQVINYTIGTGGAAGTPATAGGATSILTLTCGGGAGGTVTGPATAGGAATGATRGISGGSGAASVGGGGGAGGDSPLGGSGGRTDLTAGTGQNGILPGGGGAGGTNSNNAGGTGANGQIVIWY